MAERGPLVSIALAGFNAERTLALTIQSILSQSYSDWELIVNDDGSTDETLAVARRFTDPRVRIISDGLHKGQTARLNEMIALSRGKYYARMDADDIAYSQRLERQVLFLETHPDVDLVGSWMLVFGKDGVPLGKRVGTFAASSHSILRSVPLGHPTFMGKVSWFEANPYAQYATFSQDQQLLIRAMKSSRFDVVPEILLGYREEALTVHKQIRYRWSYIQEMTMLAQDIGRWRAAALIGVQTAKLALDVFAIGTRTDHKLLGHRAQPITKQERAAWSAIWDQLNAGDCMRQ
jgi:glycosyltransferase involved in cell wall biosynthesis